MGVINEIKFRGGTGAGPPPVFLRFAGSHPGHRSMNVWKENIFSLEWRGSVERKSGVDKWRKGASDGTMLFRIVFICMYNLFV